MKLGETRYLGSSDMSKKPSVEHKYHTAKDRLDLSVKHYHLKKKSDREDLIKHLLRGLEASPSSGGSAKSKKGKDSDRTPIKETRLPVVGD
jgi:hypothetical protein